VRRTQYRWADDPVRTADLARAFITGKIANARLVLRRGAREAITSAGGAELAQVADRLDRLLDRLPHEADLKRCVASRARPVGSNGAPSHF
jgi:CRISP-associated protein Cas1